MQALVHAPISGLELASCALVLAAVVGRGLQNIYDKASDVSNEIRQNAWLDTQHEAYFIRNHYQDVGDMEMSAFQSQWKIFLFCGLVNAACSWLLAFTNLRHLRLWSSAILGIATFVVICGVTNTAIFIIELLIVYGVMRLSRLPILFGWIVGAVHIFYPQLHRALFTDTDPFYPGCAYARLYAIWAWMWNVMRYASFGSEWQWALSKEKQNTKEESTSDDADNEEDKLCFGLLNYFAYMFYTPCNFGSIITYRHYSNQVFSRFVNKTQKFSWRPLVGQLGVVLLWLLVVQVWSELFMFYTIEQFPEAMEDLDGYGAGVATWAHGQYFQAKYMVLYGLPWLVAYLDCGVELTPLPIFISRVYLYSNMWKFFDTGLYDFLKSYIYVPVSKATGKHLGGALTFFFIWAWHGTNFSIALWTFCNFAEIVIEGVLRQACNNDRSWIHRNVRSRVSELWWRRIEALAGAIAFTFSCFAISFFLMGYQPAMAVVPKTWLPTNINFWAFIATSYCWVQTVFSYENWEAGAKL